MAQPAKAPMDEPKVTISSDGTYTPPGGVVVNPGGVVKFEVTYPTGMNICTVPFGAITFSAEAGKVGNGGNTIKVGS